MPVLATGRALVALPLRLPPPHPHPRNSRLQGGLASVPSTGEAASVHLAPPLL